MIFSISIFVFPNAPLLQAWLNLGYSFPFLWYIVEVWPFDETNFTVYELHNEAVLLLISLLSLPYLNIISDGKVREYLGWVIIALT